LAQTGQHSASADAARREVAECDRKLSTYRATLEAPPEGTDPALVAGWIAQAQAKKAAAEARRSDVGRSAPLAREEIDHLIDEAGDILATLGEADPADKAEIYKRLGVKLVFHPEQQVVRAEACLGLPHMGERFVSEDRLHQKANAS
jgi:multidrug resistance efflux pump